MEYKRFGNKIVARFDIGEEVTEMVREVAQKENIKLANITALGATNDFTIGLFSPRKKEYDERTFNEGDYEILSLIGTINTLNDEYYLHLHISTSDENGVGYGGHLKRAVISVTCEMVIDIIDGRVDRKPDEVTGINIFKF